MIILITATVTLILGLFFIKIGGYGWKGIVGASLAFTGGIVLAIALFCLPIRRMETYSGIAQYKSVELTLKQAREDNNQLENVALQHKIIDSNKWLASQVYYNSTLLDIWIPDKILELKPIK